MDETLSTKNSFKGLPNTYVFREANIFLFLIRELLFFSGDLKQKFCSVWKPKKLPVWYLAE